MNQIPLGTRVRTTVKSTKSAFRRSYDSPLQFQVIPAGATGKIANAYLMHGESIEYDIQLETIDTRVNHTSDDLFEVISDDVPSAGEIVHVSSASVNADIAEMNKYPDGYKLVQTGADEKVLLRQDDNGKWFVRWDDETQAVINRLRGIELVEAK